MSTPNKEHVLEVLQQWKESYQQQDPVSGKMLKHIETEEQRLSITLTLGFPASGYLSQCSASLKAHLQRHFPDCDLHLQVDWKIRSHQVQKGLGTLPQVRNIIAVASGKGGVGKSTTTANLALALKAEGARVGILDADLYGPSQPHIMGVTARPESEDGKHLEPVESHGIQIMSVGFMVEEDTPVIWRGSMVSRALKQLLDNTHWQDLDYLLVDLPPGTGDIQLTLAQQIPVSGAIIVTTPQDIALLDARKGLRMFEKVGIPVLGLIENMSTHICSQCGHQEAIFGTGGGERLAEQHHVDLLGQLPLDLAIRTQADQGTPLVIHAPDSAIAHLYRDIARRASARLATLNLDQQERFPRIAVVNQ